MVGIYKITNKINNKCYIGQSTCIKKRWENHKCMNSGKYPGSCYYNYPLYRAFRKYGVDNFSFEVLEECSKEELCSKELYYIQKYNSVSEGYNQTYSTDNPFNDKEILTRAIEKMKINHSTENHKKIQSEITKKLWQNDEYRKKVMEKVSSSEFKMKISKISISNWEKKSYRDKITKASKERCNTPEFRLQKSNEIKEAWKRGCYNTEAYKNNLKKHKEKMQSDKEYYNQMIEKYKANRPNAVSVYMIDKDTNNIIMEFPKLMDAAKWIRENTEYSKADYSTISKVCKGRGKTAYGFKWSLKNKEF